MDHSTLAAFTAWESFYVIVGTSTAALTGLQFVVMALVAEARPSGSMREVRCRLTSGGLPRHAEELLGEFRKRVGDPNLGGTEKRAGVMTVYRQRTLTIAQFLQQHEAIKASHIARTLRDPKAREVLYRDAYGWFDRASLGVYELSPWGKQEVPLWLERAPEAVSRTAVPPPNLRPR
ncbi:MAG: DUF2161 family putative PD-(D/E)XK-type phosphodiesterase [Gemmatimonadales bacterium]